MLRLQKGMQIYVALIYHRETDHRNDRFIMYDTSNHLMDSYISMAMLHYQKLFLNKQNMFMNVVFSRTGSFRMVLAHRLDKTVSMHVPIILHCYENHARKIQHMQNHH